MITETGYNRRTYNEILEAKILKAKEFFGEDIDTSELTPLGKFIRINTYEQAETEEEAEAIYYSIFPNTAIGTSLDRLCPFVHITRSPATRSLYAVDVKGETGAVVPYDFLVGTDAGVQFFNTSEQTIGEDGTCLILVECTEAGTMGNVNSADISVIVNPDANILSVVGKECVRVATDYESDEDLRERFDKASAGMGSCNEDSIEAALVRIDTVTSATVIVNETDNTDSEGRPPHSFECYVTGGEAKHAEIAETIFSKKPLGIKTYGDISVDVIDKGGKSHAINFSHTEQVNVAVNIKIKTNAIFEADNGKAEIVKNIQNHINGLGVGNSVIVAQLYGKITAVTGVVDITEILLNGSESNISINEFSTAMCSDVTVEVI